MWDGDSFGESAGRLSCRASTLELVAEVLKVFLTDLQLQDLFDHRNEVCQRTDRTQRRGTVWPDHSSRRCQNERVLNRFKRHTALVQLGREDSIRAADGAAGARSRTIGIQKPAYIVALVHPSALRLTQRGTVDGHRVTVMPHTTQQRIHHRFVA